MEPSWPVDVQQHGDWPIGLLWEYLLGINILESAVTPQLLEHFDLYENKLVYSFWWFAFTNQRRREGTGKVDLLVWELYAGLNVLGNVIWPI